jgi:hypothetical protein
MENEHAIELLLSEYDRLGASVRDEMTSISKYWMQPALLTGLGGLVIVANTEPNQSKLTIPVWTWPLVFVVVSLLMIQSLRRMAEFHAMGGQKRAIEDLMLRITKAANFRSPLLWETHVAQESSFAKSRRLAAGANVSLYIALVCIAEWHAWRAGELRALLTLPVLILVPIVIVQWAVVVHAGEQSYELAIAEYSWRFGVCLKPAANQGPGKLRRSVAKEIAECLNTGTKDSVRGSMGKPCLANNVDEACFNCIKGTLDLRDGGPATSRPADADREGSRGSSASAGPL